MDKKISRLRRAKRTRFKLMELSQNRLCVHKTNQHMYAQIISGDSCKTLVCASTLESIIKKECACTSNKKSASIVGKFIAKRAVNKGIKNVSFDRSGFKYHGRIKALANSARENGLKL